MGAPVPQFPHNRGTSPGHPEFRHKRGGYPVKRLGDVLWLIGQLLFAILVIAFLFGALS